VYWSGTLLYIIVSGEHQFVGRLTYTSLGSTVMVVEICSFRDFATGGDTVHYCASCVTVTGSVGF